MVDVFRIGDRGKWESEKGSGKLINLTEKEAKSGSKNSPTQWWESMHYFCIILTATTTNNTLLHTAVL